ncbi:hypothetical protein GJ496_009511 [Pomphorhynchus laevis]|nr:hypothetical protein GJ496_009511 [Pomphorhynchus laevis]
MQSLLSKLLKLKLKDTLVTRYGWTPQNAPRLCLCGNKCTIAHILSCNLGALPTIHHNVIMDSLSRMLKQA